MCIFAPDLNIHSKMRIAFTTDLPREGFKRLEAYPNPTLKGRAILMPAGENFSEADVLVSTFDYRVPREMIEAMPNLRLIANFGAGYNNIDLDACRERGIRVTNTPQPVIEPTAELAFALMMAVARRVVEFDGRVRAYPQERFYDRPQDAQSGDALHPEGMGELFGVMRNLSHSLYGKTLGSGRYKRRHSQCKEDKDSFHCISFFHDAKIESEEASVNPHFWGFSSLCRFYEI